MTDQPAAAPKRRRAPPRPKVEEPVVTREEIEKIRSDMDSLKTQMAATTQILSTSIDAQKKTQEQVSAMFTALMVPGFGDEKPLLPLLASFARDLESSRRSGKMVVKIVAGIAACGAIITAIKAAIITAGATGTN
jgi:hypothetical protein